MFPNTKCKKIWLLEGDDPIDHVDRHHNHNCCKNTIPLCYSCNAVKRTLQLMSMASNQVVKYTCQCCNQKFDCPVIGNAMAFQSVNDYHYRHDHISMCVCLPLRARVSPSMSASSVVGGEDEKPQSVDTINALSILEKADTKSSRTRPIMTNEVAWPRYRYWSLFVYHLGYPIEPDILKDSIPFEIGVQKGTVSNSYYGPITAKFSGLFQENLADKLASFERNPEIEEDEYESYLKNIIEQWKAANKDENAFKQKLDTIPLKHLARLLKMAEHVLLKKMIIRLRRAPIFMQAK